MTSIVRYQEASSSTPPRSAYHVFLSFRGEDTRRTFTDHLYTALDRVGFHTFRDNDGIERGEDIDSELQRAIQESRISIIVFSKDYASSRWCLDELVRILERKKTSEHQVLPVFYDVAPSDVRKQTGSFAESFLRHERRFNTEEIGKWRAALREIADIPGMDLKSHDGGYESIFIQSIVNVVEEKLKHRHLSIPTNPIGLHSRARDINLWVQDRSNKGIENIEGLALDMHMFKEDKSARKFNGVNKTKHIRMFSFGFSRPSVDTPYKDSNGVAFETNAFTRMRNLKILHLNYVELKGHYKEFPGGLKWLKWHGFPRKHLPNDFPLESLVALDMHYSNLRKVWKGAKILGLLKILNLSHSHSLVKTPTFGALPKLEKLIMKDCTSLTEIHESIGSLERLVFMNVEDCINLRKLPKGMGMLKLLKTLIISGCSNLTQLPEEMKNMESLKVLRADRTALDSKALALKSWFCLPYSLVTLSLAYCNLSDDDFPRDLSCLPLLLDLNLSGNPICRLPDCVRYLTKLEHLSFKSCTNLQSLFSLPSVIRLDVSYCTSLERITLASQATWTAMFVPEVTWTSIPTPQASFFGIDITGNRKLVEFEGHFKLEPIGRVDAGIINSLGICNLESIANTEMNFFRFNLHLCDHLSAKRLIRLPLQGLFEVGLFNTFIPGREVPKGWLSSSSSNSAGCSLSLLCLPVLQFLITGG